MGSPPGAALWVTQIWASPAVRLPSSGEIKEDYLAVGCPLASRRGHQSGGYARSACGRSSFGPGFDSPRLHLLTVSARSNGVSARAPLVVVRSRAHRRPSAAAVTCGSAWLQIYSPLRRRLPLRCTCAPNSRTRCANSSRRRSGAAYTLERELGGGGMSRVFVARGGARARRRRQGARRPSWRKGSQRRALRARDPARRAAAGAAHRAGARGRDDGGAGCRTTRCRSCEGESLRARLRERADARRRGGRASCATSRRRSRTRTRTASSTATSSRRTCCSPGGTAVVTDFGIAKAVGVAHDAATPTRPASRTLTQLGTSLGTPAYMAPEQAAGDRRRCTAPTSTRGASWPTSCSPARTRSPDAPPQRAHRGAHRRAAAAARGSAYATCRPRSPRS